MAITHPASDLVAGVLAGERVPLARAISAVENETPDSVAILDACFGRSGRALRLGITGPPGAGKSTLVARLAQEYRRRGETVGVGQSELEVAQTADSTAVVLVPESGDGVQAMKAGLMEIGDLFVINKADREGAERAAFAVRSALELRPRAGDGWETPALLTTASEGKGIGALADAFEAHLAHLKSRGGLSGRRRLRVEQRMRDLLRAQLWQEFDARVPPAAWAEAVESLVTRKLTPHEAVARLTARFGGPSSETRSSKP